MKPLFVFGTLVCAVACMSLQSFGAESAVVYEQFNYTPGIFTYGSATGPAATGTGLAGNYRLELNAGTGYSSNYVDAGSLAYGGLFVTNANRLRWGAVSGGSVNYLWARLTTSASNALNIASGRQTNWARRSAAFPWPRPPFANPSRQWWTASATGPVGPRSTRATGCPPRTTKANKRRSEIKRPLFSREYLE